MRIKEQETRLTLCEHDDDDDFTLHYIILYYCIVLMVMFCELRLCHTYLVNQACQTEGPPRAIWVTFVLS